jgi:hypothetical protein
MILDEFADDDIRTLLARKELRCRPPRIECGEDGASSRAPLRGP